MTDEIELKNYIKEALVDYFNCPKERELLDSFTKEIMDATKVHYEHLIQEAERSGYDKGVKDRLGLEDAQSAKITKLENAIQQAVKAERERIIEYLESMAWVFNPGKEKPEFLGIIQELKSGIWEGKVPPESTLKVLVDGEWLEASDEFKKTVTDIDQALSGGN